MTKAKIKSLMQETMLALCASNSHSHDCITWNGKHTAVYSVRTPFKGIVATISYNAHMEDLLIETPSQYHSTNESADEFLVVFTRAVDIFKSLNARMNELKAQ